MASCDEQDLLAVAAFGEVETRSTLSVRCGLNSDEEPECRSKRTVNVDGWVKVGNGLEMDSRNSTWMSLIPNFSRRSRQPCTVVWASSPESVSRATPMQSTTGPTASLSDLDKANDVYGRPPDPHGIQ